jgi:phenylalanine-4-hydroxylase
MNKITYVAKLPDKNGHIAYTPEEDSVWQTLYERQIKTLEGRACEEYLDGLRLLNLPTDRVPQCHEVSEVLTKKTGWSIAPVPALIPFDTFFTMLANKQFPAASFIRCREELDYLQEPDIFHEIFGHAPLLTNPVYADFVHTYGKIGLAASHSERVLLARLFWFTIEFGLIQTPAGLRAYGAGILSSHSETIYAVESKVPQRVPFVPLDALRMPYRYDIIQTLYFVIDKYSSLYELINHDILGLIREAKLLGEYPPDYPLHGC